MGSLLCGRRKLAAMMPHPVPCQILVGTTSTHKVDKTMAENPLSKNQRDYDSTLHYTLVPKPYTLNKTVGVHVMAVRINLGS